MVFNYICKFFYVYIINAAPYSATQLKKPVIFFNFTLGDGGLVLPSVTSSVRQVTSHLVKSRDHLVRRISVFFFQELRFFAFALRKYVFDAFAFFFKGELKA